ncbi:Uncharacterised protein [Mycobacteroides abscessus subsp. abscessus]|nr:Uncharacterised protein [Mycobacteroides abscessus subsp. abscessus]
MLVFVMQDVGATLQQLVVEFGAALEACISVRDDLGQPVEVPCSGADLGLRPARVENGWVIAVIDGRLVVQDVLHRRRQLVIPACCEFGSGSLCAGP